MKLRKILERRERFRSFEYLEDGKTRLLKASYAFSVTNKQNSGSFSNNFAICNRVRLGAFLKKSKVWHLSGRLNSSRISICIFRHGKKPEVNRRESLYFSHRKLIYLLVCVIQIERCCKHASIDRLQFLPTGVAPSPGAVIGFEHLLSASASRNGRTGG